MVLGENILLFRMNKREISGKTYRLCLIFGTDSKARIWPYVHTEDRYPSLGKKSNLKLLGIIVRP